MPIFKSRKRGLNKVGYFFWRVRRTLIEKSNLTGGGAEHPSLLGKGF